MSMSNVDSITSALEDLLNEEATDTIQVTKIDDGSKLLCPSKYCMDGKTNIVSNPFVCKYATSKKVLCIDDVLKKARKDKNDAVLEMYDSTFDDTPFMCSNPHCLTVERKQRKKLIKDAQKKGASIPSFPPDPPGTIVSNTFHIGCYIHATQTNDDRHFITKTELRTSAHNSDELDKFNILLPVCQLGCSNIVNSLQCRVQQCRTKEDERIRRIKTAIATKNTRNLPWDNDNLEPNGPTSISVLLEWLTDENNYNDFMGANSPNTGYTTGTKKEAYYQVVAEIIRQRTKVPRDAAGVKFQIMALQDKFKIASDFLNNTGEGLKGTPDEKNLRSLVLSRCRYYYELEPVFGSKPNVKAIITTDDSDKYDLSDSEEHLKAIESSNNDITMSNNEDSIVDLTNDDPTQPKITAHFNYTSSSSANKSVRSIQDNSSTSSSVSSFTVSTSTVSTRGDETNILKTPSRGISMVSSTSSSSSKRKQPTLTPTRNGSSEGGEVNGNRYNTNDSIEFNPTPHNSTSKQTHSNKKKLNKLLEPNTGSNAMMAEIKGKLADKRKHDGMEIKALMQYAGMDEVNELKLKEISMREVEVDLKKQEMTLKLQMYNQQNMMEVRKIEIEERTLRMQEQTHMLDSQDRIMARNEKMLNQRLLMQKSNPNVDQSTLESLFPLTKLD